jgi:hypothetical protein
MILRSPARNNSGSFDEAITARVLADDDPPRRWRSRRSVDLPMAWPDQWRALGLQAPAQA